MKYHLSDFFSRKRIRSVFLFFIKKIVKKLKTYLEKADGSDVYLEAHELQQYSYRLGRCPDCVKAKECTNCGCHTIGRMMNRTDYCSAGKWGEFMSKEDWEEFVEYYGLEFNISSEKEIPLIEIEE